MGMCPRDLDPNYHSDLCSSSLALQQLAGSNNPFVSARATAIASGLPGAILRLAQQFGLQQFFDSNDAFLNLTTQIYVRPSQFSHLAYPT